MIGNFQLYSSFSPRIVASADLGIDVINWSKPRLSIWNRPCDSGCELVDFWHYLITLLSLMIGNFQSYPLVSLQLEASADLDIDAINWPSKPRLIV